MLAVVRTRLSLCSTEQVRRQNKQTNNTHTHTWVGVRVRQVNRLRQADRRSGKRH